MRTEWAGTLELANGRDARDSKRGERGGETNALGSACFKADRLDKADRWLKGASDFLGPVHRMNPDGPMRRARLESRPIL